MESVIEKPKIQKSDHEFKQHEADLINKRVEAVNQSFNLKINQLWNAHLFDKTKPDPLQFCFTFVNLSKYLSVCDTYKASEHKDSKQKWWNNQKASELAMDFLPSILCFANKMAEYIGRQITPSNLQPTFTRYCQFEFMETALRSLFSTMRSGSNEVFLRTAFQYSKSVLRKLLASHFEDHELKHFDIKERKKKDLWIQLVQQKKQKLFLSFSQKRAAGERKILHSPLSTASATSAALPALQCDSSSYTTVDCSSVIPPIDWTETHHPKRHRYVRNQAIELSAPYHYPSNNVSIHSSHVHYNGVYGSHRQCTDCNLYKNKLNELIHSNNQLLRENAYLKQLNQQFMSNLNGHWNGSHAAAPYF